MGVFGSLEGNCGFCLESLEISLRGSYSITRLVKHSVGA
jgi:hypothetical protein